jgi:hypothetical protein
MDLRRDIDFDFFVNYGTHEDMEEYFKLDRKKYQIPELEALIGKSDYNIVHLYLVIDQFDKFK